MDLTIIFVNWNAVEYLTESITSIYANTTGIDFEIVVVDNASPKGDVDTLKRQFPEISIVKSATNLGFARANNLGFAHASGEYVLLLNPDTKLVGPAIDILMAHIKELPEAGIVGCKQVNPDLTVQTTSIQTFPTIVNQLLNVEVLRQRWPNCRLWKLGPLYSDIRGPLRVDLIPGACMLMRRSVFAGVGMFTEDYFMYGEDVDLNYKVRNAGFKNYYIPEAVIIHYGGKSSAQQAVSQWSTTMKYRSMNRYYTLRRGAAYAAMYRAAMGISALLRVAVINLFLAVTWRPGRRTGLHNTARKWQAVVKWACGVGGM